MKAGFVIIRRKIPLVRRLSITPFLLKLAEKARELVAGVNSRRVTREKSKSIAIPRATKVTM